MITSKRPRKFDSDLLNQARSGDHEAFAELFRLHSSQIYTISLRMLKNHEDAEDNMQNVFFKAYDNLEKFEGNSKFSTWLVRIAINEALMKLRKHRPELHTQPTDSAGWQDEEVELEVRDMRPDPERAYISKELALKACCNLHPSLRDTFLLYQTEGWTNRELARTLGVSAETVKSRVFRARTRMRQRLNTLLKTPPPLALEHNSVA